ncbi:hypothetical protein C0993_011132 [Termitomyces sp. T159_Od127]|nr:hypothetical protein C0993_011132 [Termitomyces sp. T159_Od127]
MSTHNAGVAGSQAKVTQGNKMGTQTPQDKGRPGYNAQNSLEPGEPGEPSDKEEKNTSGVTYMGESRTSQDLSELPSITPSREASERLQDESSSPPCRRVRVEEAYSDEEEQNLLEQQTQSHQRKPPGIQAGSVRLDLQKIDKQIKEALGDTTQGLSIGTIGLGSVMEDPELEHMSGDKSAWDVISFIFSKEGYDGDESTYEGTQPEPQSASEAKDMEGESVPDLQSVSDTEISTVSEKPDTEPLEEPGTPGRGASKSVLGNDDESEAAEDQDEIIMAWPEDFGRDTYDFEVPNGEVRLDILWKEELARGRPDRIGSPHACKLENFLERRQPYPGDPANCLQYWGRRFMSYDISKDEVCLVDIMRDFNTVLPKSLVEDKNFEPSLWYAHQCHTVSGVPLNQKSWCEVGLTKDIVAWNAAQVLELGAPYLKIEGSRQPKGKLRFKINRITGSKFEVVDHVLEFRVRVSEKHLNNPLFNLANWYEKQLEKKMAQLENVFLEEEREQLGINDLERIQALPGEEPALEYLGDVIRVISVRNQMRVETTDHQLWVLELYGQQVEAGTFPALLCNNIRRKDVTRTVPKPLVIVVKVEGHPVRVLVDSGSLGDFMSTTLVEQAKSARNRAIKIYTCSTSSTRI